MLLDVEFYGRIGIAYIASGLNNLADVGDVYYMESTNSGTSFGTPLRIFNSDFISDSLCALRGISMVFKDNSPCVVFETVVREPTSNGDYPQYPSKIRFWCPAINSGISLVIADKNNVPFAPAYGHD